MVGGGARVMVRADGRADGERGRQGLLEPVILLSNTKLTELSRD